MLALHLKSEKIPYEREYTAIPDRNFRFDFHCRRNQNYHKNPLNYPVNKLLVEVQGGVWLKGKSGHSSGAGITRDCEKLSLAAVAGYRTIVVTPAQIKSGKAIEWIKAALA